MRELKERILELEYAIRLTQTFFNHCSTPLLKDLYLSNIEYYKAEIFIAESQLIAYNNIKNQEH